MRTVELAIIGGGPAGMAAAQGAWEEGIRDIVIFERDEQGLGGILNQCIHSGFGLRRFGRELTGPEYAARDIAALAGMAIDVRLGCMVLDIAPGRVIRAAAETGCTETKAGAVVLAMGCRERPRGALDLPGTRPAGVFTAGTAQKFVNIDGLLPGREAVVLGSGDIGLIMARRLTLEGARVRAVLEILPRAGGLERNVVQCLEDFGIPLLLSHTVTRVIGRERVEAVEYARVDDSRRPVPGTEGRIDCDTLLLSVGLLPENELSRGLGVRLSPATGGAATDAGLLTSVPGVFACGNVRRVHDLADNVSAEGLAAGRNAARHLRGKPPIVVADDTAAAPAVAGAGGGEAAPAGWRREFACTACPVGCRLVVTAAPDGTLAVRGNQCPRGIAYAEAEVAAPTRVLTTTVRLDGGAMRRLPVKSAVPAPRDKLLDCVRALAGVRAAAPAAVGQTIARGVCGLGIDMIATRSVVRVNGALS